MAETENLGRKRPQLSGRTWCVRTPTELDKWLRLSAEEEQVRPSTLIRKSVSEYLTVHHSKVKSILDLMPETQTKNNN